MEAEVQMRLQPVTFSVLLALPKIGPMTGIELLQIRRKLESEIEKVLAKNVSIIRAEAVTYDPVDVSVSYEPMAIRTHFEGIEDGDSEDERELDIEARLAKLTDQQLFDAARDYLSDAEHIWERFHEHCLDIVEDAEEEAPVA